MEKIKHILVIGDVGVDVYTTGIIKRLSPEAPIPIVENPKEEVRLGLAANVANNIKALGTPVKLIGVTGYDAGRIDLSFSLAGAGLLETGLITDINRKTTTKRRIMSEHFHLARVDYESKEDISGMTEVKVIEEALRLLPDSSAVVFQDYGKGVCTWRMVEAVSKKAKELKLPVFVDPTKTTKLLRFRGATVITPNLLEFEELAKGESVRSVIEDYDFGAVIITKGKDGATLYTKDSEQHFPAIPTTVFDVTGAGDTFVAALAVAYVNGKSLGEACAFANEMASIVVGKVGTATRNSA